MDPHDTKADIDSPAELSPPEAPISPPAPAAVATYLNHAGRRSLALSCPFRVGEQVVEEIHVDPPTFAVIRDWRTGKIGGQLQLLEVMTGLPIDILDHVRWPDFHALLEISLDLLPDFIVASLQGAEG